MIDRHTITRAEFVALAAGGGSGETVARLRKGQLSKNIIRIRAIMQAAAQTYPDEYAASGFADAYALLVAAQRRAPDTVADMLAHPQVGAWTGRCLWRMRNADPAGQPPVSLLGHLGAVGAAAAVHAGHEFTIEVPAYDGQVMLPALGLCAPQERSPADAATVTYRRGRLTVRVGEAVVAVPADLRQDGPGWLPLRQLTTETGGLRLTVDLDDIDPYRAGGELIASGRTIDRDVARWQDLLDGAWRLLVTLSRDRAEAMAAGLATLVPLAADGNSATSRDAFGAVLLAMPPDAPRLAETLVHEFQHSKLDALLDMIPLHEAAEGELFYSPAREDPRPLAGMLQGAYAYAGVVDFWRRYSTVTEEEHARSQFATWREQVERVSTALLDTGRLTPAGVDFVSGMLGQMRQWDDAVVSDEQRAAARDAADDHQVRWRLNNLPPDPGTVQALARAWANGEPRPDREYVAPSPRPRPPDVPTNWRVELRRLRERNPERFAQAYAAPHGHPETGHASAGDLAYLAGDYAQAVQLYVKQIAADPADIDHWAGLLLARRRLIDDGATWALHRVPELARAVHLAVVEVSGTAPDPEALAGWLGSAQAAPSAG
jgi:HEXXH motif-containing protein